MKRTLAFIALFIAALSVQAAVRLDGTTIAPQFNVLSNEALPPLVRGGSPSPLLQVQNPCACADFNVRRQWVETKLSGWSAALDAHDCRATPNLAENALDAAGLVNPSAVGARPQTLVPHRHLQYAITSLTRDAMGKRRSSARPARFA